MIIEPNYTLGFSYNSHNKKILTFREVTDSWAAVEIYFDI